MPFHTKPSHHSLPRALWSNVFLGILLSVFLGSPQTVLGQLLPGVAVGATTPLAQKSIICNYNDYKLPGNNDFGANVVNTFKSCVKLHPGSTLFVPAGTYVARTQAMLENFSNWALRLDGVVTRDPVLKSGHVLIIHRCNDVEVYSQSGTGAIQGHGYIERKSGHNAITRLLAFLNTANISVHDLFLIDSPSFHLNLENCQNCEVYKITIRGRSQGGSDGIDLIGCNNTHVHTVTVTNRDDCVSVKSPAINMLIEDVTCNFSGGVSLGSFKTGTKVEKIHIRNVKSYKTNVQMFIKTFPGGDGYVRDCLFENFWGYDTAYTIDIDQYWFQNGLKNKKGGASGVQLSDLTFRNFTGTTFDGDRRGGIMSAGSDPAPVTNVVFEDINVWDPVHKVVKFTCVNTYGKGGCAIPGNPGTHAQRKENIITITKPPSGWISESKPSWGVEGYGLTKEIPINDDNAYHW